MIALLALAVVAVAAIAALVFITIRARLLPGPSLARKTIVIHTRRPDDQTFRGVLIAQHADRVTLRDVVYLYSDGDQPVGGLVHVPTASISWMQEIEAGQEGE